MRYVRFLRDVRCEHGQVDAVVALCSDLGDTFFPGDVLIDVHVISPFPNCIVYASVEGVLWKSGMRALRLYVTLDRKYWDSDFQVRVSVNPACQQYSDFVSRFPHELCDVILSNSPLNPDPIILPAVLSAWSPILKVRRGRDSSDDDNAYFVERIIKLPSLHVLRISEEIGESIAKRIWDGGLVTAAYLSMISLGFPSNMLPNNAIIKTAQKRDTMGIIELGCGSGIVGLTLHQVLPNSNVVLTDVQDAFPVVRRNIFNLRMFSPPASHRVEQGAGVSWHVHNWDTPLPAALLPPTFNVDLILVSDCTYNLDSADSLVNTIVNLVAGQKDVLVLLTTKVRHDDEIMFLHKLLNNNFKLVEKTMVNLPSDHALIFDSSFHCKREHVDFYLLQHC